MTKTKSAARVYIRGCLKVLMASVMAATQCITVTLEIRARAQNPPSVDLPSLAGKSMGDIYQQFKSSRKVCKEVDKEFLARVPPDMPPFDDFCEFKVGGGNLYVLTYRGRALAFQYVFGPSICSIYADHGDKGRARLKDKANGRFQIRAVV